MRNGFAKFERNPRPDMTVPRDARPLPSWPRLVLWPGSAILLAFALLVGLGIWQVERLGWKENLIAAVVARTHLAPVPLPSAGRWASLDTDAWNYRPVEMRGRFLNDREAHVFTTLNYPRGPFGGEGYWVLTPLVLDGGGTVIVNRGFVPMAKVDPATRPDSLPQSEVTVRGLVRLPQGANLFTPADQPGKHLFYSRDPAAIAAAYGLGVVAPFTVDAVAGPDPAALPEGGETRVTFPNNHLQYALTWFGLAVVLAVFTAIWISRRVAAGRSLATPQARQ